MSNKLRTGDQVVIIAGNDRGKFGKVISRNGDKVIVEGVNVRKKHMKKTQQNQKGQIIDIECPIHISNVKISVNEKPVKLKVRHNQNGERELYYVDGGSEQLYRPVNKAK